MSPRQKARDLIELAFDESTTDEERLNAAMRALKIIRKYELLSSPIDGLKNSDNETVRAATDIFERITDPLFVRNVKKVASRLGRARRR